MPLPDVILLNGCSCSGKSTLTQALQDRLPAPYMRMGLDDFVFELAPDRWHGSEEGIRFLPAANGAVSVAMGEAAMRMQRGFHRSVRACVDVGLKVVVDDVLIDEQLLPDWLEVLSGVDVFFVGVHCDLEELEMRERARRNRSNGVVRGQWRLVHAHGLYDLEIDSTATPASRLAGAVIEGLGTRPSPSAFEQLRAAP